MPHRGPADTLPLILVDDSKRDFGLPGLHEDVAATADDILRASFRRDDNKGDLIDEVDVEEARRLFVGKLTLHAKKSTINRRRAHPVDRRLQGSPVLGSLLANLHL